MERKTGVVVPLSALSNKDCAPVGDFLALKPFADFCREAGFSVIQLLPVNDTGTHSSPYSGLSAFALHPLYIRIEALPEFEKVKADKAFAKAYRAYKRECAYRPRFDYTEVTSHKIHLLHLMYDFLEKGAKQKGSQKGNVNVVTVADPSSEKQQLLFKMEDFISKNDWVIPYAIFKNLKDDYSQASWKSWPEELRQLSQKDLELRWANKALRESHNFFVWCQMRAAEQFKEAADYVRSLGIILKGDIPILMNEDSADCWAFPEFFTQEWRAGSPPDGENPLGQNWGFPTYNWKNLSQADYTWWKKRIQTASAYYSAFRIDHILGFFRIWAVNERDSTAFLGHTEPYESFTREQLNELGFDNARIRWLSKPHIPTGLIEDITWNHEEAVADLSYVCERVGNEELWLFKDSVTSDGDIRDITFSQDGTKNQNIQNALCTKWRDRALIEIEKDRFIQVWHYGNSTAWQSLSGEERESLEKLFAATNEAQNILWGKQALEVLTPIVEASGMQPCAEDLGASLSAMPEVLQKLSILSLKVVRWTRSWEKEGQPYVPFENYPLMSVATTSVHDSSTLRQWWNTEKQSVEAYLRLTKGNEEDVPEPSAEFSANIARYVLETSARCNSAWFINPLQDYLFMDDTYYLPNADDERINVPGSVNDFNWTYRLPVDLEMLSKNTELIKNIGRVVRIHQGGNE